MITLFSCLLAERVSDYALIFSFLSGLLGCKPRMALKAMLVNRVGDSGLLLAMFLIYKVFGTESS